MYMYIHAWRVVWTPGYFFSHFTFFYSILFFIPCCGLNGWGLWGRSGRAGPLRNLRELCPVRGFARSLVRSFVRSFGMRRRSRDPGAPHLLSALQAAVERPSDHQRVQLKFAPILKSSVGISRAHVHTTEPAAASCAHNALSQFTQARGKERSSGEVEQRKGGGSRGCFPAGHQIYLHVHVHMCIPDSGAGGGCLAEGGSDGAVLYNNCAGMYMYGAKCARAYVHVRPGASQLGL
ncbi:hypothetical protein DFH11DRAFT_71720 [Phellopilus nigrolimitatus]|nr:hypothetical protein DFH11DRAFT_71720 [Phellopilus nigrolimitatus]